MLRLPKLPERREKQKGRTTIERYINIRLKQLIQSTQDSFGITHRTSSHRSALARRPVFMMGQAKRCQCATGERNLRGGGNARAICRHAECSGST